MKIAFLVTTLIALAGCGGSGGNNNNPSPTPQQQQTVDITDTSTCQELVPVGQTLIGGWTSSSETQDHTLRFDLTLHFDGTILTATNVCTALGQSVTAETEVPYTSTGNTITVLGNGTKTVSASGLDCTVSVQTMTVSYSLAGNCLALTMNGQTGELVRSGN